MNDEIKEIKINKANKSVSFMKNNEIAFSQFAIADEILDYIINLQQENERLKLNHKQLKDIEKMAISNSKLIQENEKLKEELFESVNNTNKSMELTEDYKSRCEKAIEYIEEMLYPMGSCVNGSDLPYESIESLLNILQNGSDDNE